MPCVTVFYRSLANQSAQQYNVRDATCFYGRTVFFVKDREKREKNEDLRVCGWTQAQRERKEMENKKGGHRVERM